MSILRYIIFVLVFCVDIHVKAMELNHCWGKKIPCAVEASAGKYVLKAKGLTISMETASLIEQRDPASLHLLRGAFYLDSQSKVQFRTPYGKIWCTHECQALSERKTDQWLIKSLAGEWRLQRTGDEQTYVVPVGQQVLLGEVTDEGTASFDFPQSLPWTTTIKQWADLYPGTPAEFKKKVAEFRSVWREAVATASEAQANTVSRTIAAYQKAQQIEHERLDAREREDRALRQMFREKNP